jgi:hypothetical protein
MTYEIQNMRNEGSFILFVVTLSTATRTIKRIDYNKMANNHIMSLVFVGKDD